MAKLMILILAFAAFVAPLVVMVIEHHKLKRQRDSAKPPDFGKLAAEQGDQMNFKDVKASDEPGSSISLVKLTGKKVKDVVGHLTTEFGDPTFQLSKIVLEDGSVIHCEGEHDMPYLTGIPGVSDEDLESLNNEARKAFNEHYGIKDEETE